MYLCSEATAFSATYSPAIMNDFTINGMPPYNWISAASSPMEQEVAEFVKKWLSPVEYIEVQTSGSTGMPKLIRHPKQAMLHSAHLTCNYLQLQPGMNALFCLSVKNIAGMMMVVRAFERRLNLLVGTPGSHPLKVPVQDMPPDALTPTHPLQPIDFCAMVPAQVFNSLHDPEQKKRLEGIRNLIVGGAPISYRLKLEIATLPGKVWSTFGMTETISHIALQKLNGADASDDYTLMEDITMETGDWGNLIIHAPHLSTVPIVTNDLIEITGTRTFRWLGRLDHVINSGGFKIYPETVENKIAPILNLYRQPELPRMISRPSDHINSTYETEGSSQRFFIASLPDDKLGNIPVLIIEGRPFENHSEKRLLKDLQSVLPHQEVPREIFFVDRFIETPTHKIIRSATIRQRLMR